LKTGSSTANRVAEITGVKRGTTYDNLNLLINKGIVSTVIKDKVHFYEAVDPKKIVSLLEEKKQKIEKIIPELQNLRENFIEKTGVTFFEGKKGVLTLLNDVLDVEKEFWFYGSRKMALNAFKHYPENFIQKRADKNIKLKAVLAEEDSNDPVYKDKKIFKLSDIRFLKELNQISADVFIYGNRIAFLTCSDNGIIIRNKEVLEQQKIIFNLLWKISKK